MNISTILKFFCLLSLLPCYLFAYLSPLYELADTQFPTIQFTNEAVFTIHGLFSHKIDDWNIGDDVLLSCNDNNFLQLIVNENETPKIHPLLHISNQDKGNTVFGYLTTPPQIDLVTITSMDSNLGTISLSDSSILRVKHKDQRFFTTWNVGDSVLIGENKGIDQSSYPWFIYNVDHSEIVHVALSII